MLAEWYVPALPALEKLRQKGCPRSGCEHRKLGPILGRQLLSISSFPTDLTCQIHMGSQMANLSAASWSGGWAHPFPQQAGTSLDGGIIPTSQVRKVRCRRR